MKHRGLETFLRIQLLLYVGLKKAKVVYSVRMKEIVETAVLQDEPLPFIEATPGRICLKDRRSKTEIGAVAFTRIGGPQHPDRKLLVNKFDVIPRHQGRGYGKMLMTELKRILDTEQRTGVLSVHADNRRAQAFYTDEGWEFDDSVRDTLPNKGQRADHLQLWMIRDPEA